MPIIKKTDPENMPQCLEHLTTIHDFYFRFLTTTLYAMARHLMSRAKHLFFVISKRGN